MSYFFNTNDEKKYMEYVEKGREEHRSLRSKVMDILGCDYEGLYLFFWKRLSDQEYDYMVLMSRRCFVLCQLYVLFFMLDGKIPINKMKIISDRALIKHKKEILENARKVQIIDDILIHGRTIRDICNMFSNTPVHVDSYVYLRCVDMECVNEEVRAKLYSSIEGNAGQWRELSDKLVQVIHTANIPYTSYVPSYTYFECAEQFINIEKAYGNKVIENTSLLQKKVGIRSVCIFNQVCKDMPIFKSLALGQCVRVYYKSESKKTLIIPCVVLKRMKRSRFVEMLKDISPIFMAECPSIANLFGEVDDSNEQMLELKMRLLTCIMSNVYWKKCREVYGLEADLEVLADVDTIEKSFGVDIANEISVFEEKQISQFCDFSFEVEDCLERTTNIEEQRLISYLVNQQTEESVEDALLFYFQQAWKYDEERAKLQKSRLSGLPVELFLQYLGEDKEKVLATLINAWDTGIATANCLFSQDGETIGCHNAPGEQGYKIILCRNAYLFSVLVYISKYFQGLQLNDQEYKKARLDLMQKVISVFEEKMGRTMSDVREIVETEDGNIQEWDSADTIEMYIDRCTYEENELLLQSVLKESLW